RHPGFGLAFEPPTVEHLAFERGEEALGHRVVVGIAHRAHRRHDAGFPAALAESIARVLGPPVRMVDDAARLTLRHRHLQRVEDQLGAHVRVHGPADDFARVHVQHHRQIQPARPSRDIGHVRHPQLVGRVGEEPALHQIDGLGRLRIALRGHHVLAQRGAPQAVLAHQPGHALAADVNAVIVRQLGVDARGPVGLPRAAVDRADRARQFQIPPLPLAHRAFQPGVKPAPGHAKQSAHDLDRMGGLIRLHEPEERFEGPFSVANQAAAFERMSRSSFSRRFSRRRRCSSSRSALVSPPSPLPASRWACLTQSPIVQAEGPNSLDSDAGVRPVPTNATICRLNSGAYRTVLSAMVNSSKSNDEVPTKPGQLQLEERLEFSIGSFGEDNEQLRRDAIKKLAAGIAVGDYAPNYEIGGYASVPASYSAGTIYVNPEVLRLRQGGGEGMDLLDASLILALEEELGAHYDYMARKIAGIGG